MANGLIYPPPWRDSLTFPNNYPRIAGEHNNNIETQCAGTSGVQTNSLNKPRVFCPVVIYQTSHGSSSRETSENSSANDTQMIPSAFGLNDDPRGTEKIGYTRNNSNRSHEEINVNSFYWNHMKQNMHTFCEKCVISPSVAQGHSLCTDFSVNVLKWRDYNITPSYNTMKSNFKDSNKRLYYQQSNTIYRSAFRRPSRKYESMKCHHNVNDGVVALSESFLQVKSQNVLFGSSRNSDGWLMGCFQNSLPIPNPLSSTMNSLPHFPYTNMEDNKNYFVLDKLDSASNVKHFSIEQSLVSNVVTALDQQHEESLETSKDCGNSHNSRTKKGTLSGSANRPFKCQCGSTFARNEELTRHQRIHSGYKPHLCHICCKRFGRKDHLNKHVKTHLHSSEKKVHLCDLPNCGQTYTRSDALARHQMNSHGIKAKPSKWRP